MRKMMGLLLAMLFMVGCSNSGAAQEGNPSPSSPSPSPCFNREELATQTTQAGTLLQDSVKALRQGDVTSAASDLSSLADLTDTMATETEQFVPGAAGEMRTASARLRSAAEELQGFGGSQAVNDINTASKHIQSAVTELDSSANVCP